MYLTIYHPEILEPLESLSVGLWAPKIGDEKFLIIKASKEIILTAKINKGFTFYLTPIEVNGEYTFALISAFYDTDDEPLIITTPLIGDDGSTNDLIDILNGNEFKVCFFDNNNRELLSYNASLNSNKVTELLKNIQFPHFDKNKELIDQSNRWFSVRDESDEQKYRINVSFVDSLFPEDIDILDMRDEKHQFIGSKSFSHSSLIRSEPGPFQEMDLIHSLQNVFDGDMLYLNPIKLEDNKEFVDIIAFGDKYLFLIQAKDSPNTEEILRNSIKRKIIKSISQLKEASSQLQGAFSYVRANEGILKFTYDKNTIELNVSNKQIIGIVVVKELFDNQFEIYSDIAFGLIKKSGYPVFFFDYPEFAKMTLYCNSEEKLITAFEQIYTSANELGEYPRLRFSGKPNDE